MANAVSQAVHRPSQVPSRDNSTPGGADPFASCHVIHFGSVRAMTEALTWYIIRQFDIECAADGWIRLSNGRSQLVLTTAPPSPAAT